MSAKFIVLEGSEGVGKSSGLATLESVLKNNKIDFITTREPGGTGIAEQIRKILLKREDEMLHPETELLLMFAARVQHIKEVIHPALQAGKWVLSDRFVEASYAYQGGGRQVPIERIEYFERWLVSSCSPDLTLLLDCPVDIAFSRISDRELDRFEQEERDFFERVRQAYLTRAQQNSDQYSVVDASQAQADVLTSLTERLQAFIDASR